MKRMPQDLLPPRIFLAGVDAHQRIEDVLREVGPQWREDLTHWGPWQEADPISGIPGLCFAAAKPVASPVVVVPRCASSLDLLSRAAAVLPPWGSVLAVHQSAGRGQLRRRWWSQAGNILAAVRWPQPPAAVEPLLPLMIGLSLAGAFRELGVALAIKWPNDLVWQGRKVGGVLVEERSDCLAAGIGINLVQAPDASMLRDPWAYPATSLAALGRYFRPLTLWQDLVNRAQNWYMKDLCEQTSSDLVALLHTFLAGWREQVRVLPTGQSPFTGVLSGIAPDGALRITTASGVATLSSGSYTLFPTTD